jgi:hypothetical protein
MLSIGTNRLAGQVMLPAQGLGHVLDVWHSASGRQDSEEQRVREPSLFRRGIEAWQRKLFGHGLAEIKHTTGLESRSPHRERPPWIATSTAPGRG